MWQSQKNQVYYEGDSEENCFNCLLLQRNPQRLSAEKMMNRKMEEKQTAKQKKGDENLKIHKKRNNIRQYQTNKNILETSPTEDKIFQEEQNEKDDSSSLQSIQFINVSPQIFGLTNNIDDDQEQVLSKQQENIKQRNYSSSSNQRKVKKKSKKQDTKNLLQFFWNTLKNKLELLSKAKELVEFSLWFSKNKRASPSMKLITELYGIKEVQDFITQLFDTKFFFRALMLSSTKTENKKVFVSFLRQLQRSFFKKKLDHIH